MIKRTPLVLVILCALALSSFALPTRSFLKQNSGAFASENPELDNISNEMEFMKTYDVTSENPEVEDLPADMGFMEPDALTGQDPEAESFSDEMEFMETGDVISEDSEVEDFPADMGFMEPDALTGQDPEGENFSAEMEFMETGATGYYVCTQAGGKIITKDPKNTTGCTVLNACTSANKVGASHVRLWTGLNKTGTCYDFSMNYTGTIDFKSVELGIDVEMVVFKTRTSATTLLESTNSVSVSSDSTMQIRVMNPDAIRLYFLPNFQGHYFDLTATTLNNANTLIRSARLGRNIEGVNFYSGINHGGASTSTTESKITSLASNVSGDVKSIVLFKELAPNAVRLFSGPKFTGAILDVQGSVNLNQYSWHNKAQSMRLGENVRMMILYDAHNFVDSYANHAFKDKLVPNLHSSVNKKASSSRVILECPK